MALSEGAYRATEEQRARDQEAEEQAARLAAWEGGWRAPGVVWRGAPLQPVHGGRKERRP